MANTNTVWMFENEKEFQSFIEAEPHHVFGDEKIHWIVPKLQGLPTLPGAKHRDRHPDLMGKDSKGNIVIKEVVVSPGGDVSEIESLNQKYGLAAKVKKSIIKTKPSPTTFKINLSDDKAIKFEI